MSVNPDHDAGEPCDDCGERPGIPHGCLLDSAYHRHGMTHVRDGSDTPLRWLCDACYLHACDVELTRLYEIRAEHSRGTTEEPAWLHEHIALIQSRRPLAAG